MNDTRSGKKDKNQHIQVFVRVRPCNNVERLGKSASVVEVSSSKEVIIREKPQEKLSKKFTFDKVFGPLSKQIDVYNAVVSPLLEEVLAGYNCTVFAYGQTGTGKTFTMEGVSNDPALHWQSDTAAGIIPRALSHLFDELRLLEAQEYSVRVSFLELYNEELFDLLSPNDDASKIRLYEDSSRKGAVIIHGLEEVTVHNKSEVYKILEKGSEKRQTAATLMNAHSSRSHTVFSITVHIKENTVDGEELLKTGKLNLVDLAGSENVARSGAVDRRAREAGNINQSLLTLGRVITALVERAPHVPYRESKLTRLLQESLGGRTKTSIIATVSPANINIEETLSTLDYAHRAKNITNRPEINQKLSKKALLKEYTEEIERLRRDLLATRERNGVYLAQENYNEMQTLIDYQGREIEEKINHIKVLEETMLNKEKLFNDLKLEHEMRINEMQEIKYNLANTISTLKLTEESLDVTKQDRDEQKYLLEKHVLTEEVLFSQAETLLNVASTAASDTYKLHDKIYRKSKVEQENENITQQFKNEITNRFRNIENDLSLYTEELSNFFDSIKSRLENTSNRELNETSKISSNLIQDITNACTIYSDSLEKGLQNAINLSEQECTSLNKISIELVSKVENLIKKRNGGIAQNLQILYTDVSEKLQKLAIFATKSIDEIYNYRVEECDRLRKNIEEIKQQQEEILRHQNESMQEQQQFAKVFKDLYHQFNDLHKNEKQRHSTIFNILDYASKSYSEINDQISNDCISHRTKKEDLENALQNDISIIDNNILKGTNENCVLAEEAIQQGNILVTKLQEDLHARQDALIEYKNIVEYNTNEIKQKKAKDKNAYVASIKDIYEIIEDSHTTINAATSSIENCKLASTDKHNEIAIQLCATQEHVEKFFSNDIRRDLPTGLTPVRKEFHYPRKLVVTSPHNRILERFREARKNSESPNNEDNTILSLEDTTLKETSNSEAVFHVTTSPVADNMVLTTSTPNCNINNKCAHTNDGDKCNIVKAASASDISIISRPLLESSSQSESEICTISNKNNDKENGEHELQKSEQDKTKGLSKLKNSNRKVLGEYN